MSCRWWPVGWPAFLPGGIWFQTMAAIFSLAAWFICAKHWCQQVQSVLQSEDDNLHPTFLCHYPDPGVRDKEEMHSVAVVILMQAPVMAHIIILDSMKEPVVATTEQLPKGGFRTF